MTYDSPLSAFEGEVIPEVASFKMEGLVTQEGWDWEKGKLKICWAMGKLNSGHVSEMQECWPLHLPDIVIKQSRLQQSVLWNKRSNFTNPSQTKAYLSFDFLDDKKLAQFWALFLCNGKLYQYYRPPLDIFIIFIIQGESGNIILMYNLSV